MKQFAEDRRVQLHWQNVSDSSVTQFVAETTVRNLEELRTWVFNTTKNNYCPRGYQAMICDSQSPYWKA